MRSHSVAGLWQFAGITLASVVVSLIVVGGLSAWPGFRMNASVVAVLGATCCAAVWANRRKG